MEKILRFGAAYYPELWDDETICVDVSAMKRLGINTVRIGEFAWSKMEPAENEIDLSYFLRILSRLHENGISVILCTPTATPPIWISSGHPERMFRDRNGIVTHGARQHDCTNKP